MNITKEEGEMILNAFNRVQSEHQMQENHIVLWDEEIALCKRIIGK